MRNTCSSDRALVLTLLLILPVRFCPCRRDAASARSPPARHSPPERPPEQTAQPARHTRAQSPEWPAELGGFLSLQDIVGGEAAGPQRREEEDEEEISQYLDEIVSLIQDNQTRRAWLRVYGPDPRVLSDPHG